jgi:hypothetical protein
VEQRGSDEQQGKIEETRKRTCSSEPTLLPQMGPRGRKLKEPFNRYVWHSSHHGRCPFGAPTTKASEGLAGSTVSIFRAPHFRGVLRCFCGKHFHVHYNDINEEARPKYCHDVGRRVSVRRSARLHGTAMNRWEVSMVPRR